MKKLVVYSTVLAVATICGLYAEPAAAQGTPSTPHKIALIDMAHVFKEYEKFKALSDALRAEVESSDAASRGPR